MSSRRALDTAVLLILAGPAGSAAAEETGDVVIGPTFEVVYGEKLAGPAEHDHFLAPEIGILAGQAGEPLEVGAAYFWGGFFDSGGGLLRHGFKARGRLRLTDGVDLDLAGGTMLSDRSNPFWEATAFARTTLGLGVRVQYGDVDAASGRRPVTWATVRFGDPSGTVALAVMVVASVAALVWIGREGA